MDNHVWDEGYIMRDVNAGTLMKAAIPYLPNRERDTIEKLFNGTNSQAVGLAVGEC